MYELLNKYLEEAKLEGEIEGAKIFNIITQEEV